MIPARTLHCANAPLYAGLTLLVWAAAVYVVFFREEAPPLQLWTAVAASLAALLWGGYYVLLRYVVTEQGIARRVLGKGTTLLWSELTCAHWQKSASAEISRVSLVLESPGRRMELSSDLLDGEALQALADDLAAAGKLDACSGN